MCKIGLSENPRTTRSGTGLSRYREQSIYACFTAEAEEHERSKRTSAMGPNTVRENTYARFVIAGTDEQSQGRLGIAICFANWTYVVLRLSKINAARSDIWRSPPLLFFDPILP